MSDRKQLKIGDVKRTHLNLIQQEFYSRFPQAQSGVISQPHCESYYELREVPTQDGIVQRLEEVDYPITKEYVKSFAQSADYHNDLNSAMATPPRGANVGDATSLQELCAMDLSAIQSLKDKIAVVEKEKLAKVKAQSAPNGGADVNKEKGVGENV